MPSLSSLLEVLSSSGDHPPVNPAGIPTPLAAPRACELGAASFSDTEEIPRGLKFQPWPHQIRGFRACMGSIRKFGFCLCAAEMGVGKTAICTMCAVASGSRSTLVVCPLRVIGSWRGQLAQYLDGDYLLTVLDDSRTVAKRLEQFRKESSLAASRGIPHWVVINYESFWREPISDAFAKHQWGAIIYDECHRLKAPASKASMMARRLRPTTNVRILATGTPLAHSPLDAYAICRAGNPAILGSNYVAFRQRYALWGGPNNRIRIGFQNIGELEGKLAPVMWRATKEEVLPDLPEQVSVDYECDLGRDAARLYASLEKAMVADIDGRTISATNVLTKVLRLQQICGGAVPDDDGKYHAVDDAKQKLLADVIEDLGGKPFVVFCRFRSDIDFAHRACAEAGVEALELSGRFNQLERWQSGEGQALIVQMQAGSVGISLVRASTAIYYSLSTSLAEWDQSQARIHRPGQKNACTYVYLVCKGTVDAKILRALRSRQEVIEAIMNNIQEKANAK